MFSTNRVGLGATLVMAAGAVLLSAGQVRADGPDVRVSFSIGGPEPLCRPVVLRPEPECDYAGTLTIDGRRFQIDTSCSVTGQIRAAFERMGYDAWCVGRSVRVLKDCEGPEVCWRTGEYSVAFRERRSTITITPFVEECREHYGRHDRFAFEVRGGERHYQAYRAMDHAGPAGETSWQSMGSAAFVSGERDLDDEIGRPEERRDDRGSWTDRRGVEERRESTQTRPEVVRRSPTGGESRLPIERKRDMGPVERVKTMPSDRVVTSKPVEKPVAKPESKATGKTDGASKGKAQDDPASRKRDAREDTKKRW